jgi:hypothetical protein
MTRFLVSFFVALLIGAGLGVYLGWVQFPVEYVDSPASALDTRFKDEYTMMIAAGYAVDQDLNGAIERLRMLQVENVPEYVQATTERFISNSRAFDDIRLLVNLAEGMGRLTPIMEPYRQVNVPGQPS